MAKPGAIKVAILWHMHQPNYREPHSDRLAMPWVRLHALKDYLDMPLTAAACDDTKVTFNLVPSLLDQLELYLKGGTDRHLQLTRIRATELSGEHRLELLQSFFQANPAQMIVPYPRYRQLHRKYRSGATGPATLPSLFSSEEFRDLQVWSNLVWVDPVFRDQEPVRSLFAKGRHFTEEEKHSLIDWQIELIGRIVPTYKKLQDEGRIEVSFTPYYHPILPLLCDTEVAREALPSITLPRTRFAHPEDAERQIVMSIEKYRSMFGRDMAGVWPSEGSISEEVLNMLHRLGVQWVAGDEEILVHSLGKSGLDKAANPLHSIYEFGAGPRLIFRDHDLSDRVGFVYSTWDADKAVADFMGHLRRLRSLYRDRLGETVVPVILDGENAWEYFRHDATDFLRLLYKNLNDDPEIETVTMSEAATSTAPRPLPSVFAGSWINHNFRIWIGHEEDNAAWELLKETRDTLVRFQQEQTGYDPEKLSAAWNQIYVAEGSDWCWWYGDEHRGPHNEQFDRLYRQHLIAVYEWLGLDIPVALLRPIHEAGINSYAILPDCLLSPEIDGRLTHFYEWAGAGYFDCLKAGATMHRVRRELAGIHFAYDREHFYIRLDFRSKKDLEFKANLKVTVTFDVPVPVSAEIDLDWEKQESGEAGQYRYALGEILELMVDRKYLWSEGFGKLGFTVTLYENGQQIENWPEHGPLQLQVPRRDQEIFWPT